MLRQRHYVVLVNRTYEVWHLAAKALLTKLVNDKAMLVASFTDPTEAEALRCALETSRTTRTARDVVADPT
jgi:hypothetical protein